MTKIRNLIVEYRTQEGITQSELAQRTGVSQPTIASLEKGENASLLTKAKISKFFNIKIDELE